MTSGCNLVTGHERKSPRAHVRSARLLSQWPRHGISSHRVRRETVERVRTPFLISRDSLGKMNSSRVPCPCGMHPCMRMFRSGDARYLWVINVTRETPTQNPEPTEPRDKRILPVIATVIVRSPDVNAENMEFSMRTDDDDDDDDFSRFCLVRLSGRRRARGRRCRSVWSLRCETHVLAWLSSYRENVVSGLQREKATWWNVALVDHPGITHWIEIMCEAKFPWCADMYYIEKKIFLNHISRIFAFF